MIHQFIFAGPKPGLDPLAFQSYWLHFHAVDYAAKIPQIRQYLVATRVPGFGEREIPFFAGVAEIWLENDSEQIASLQTPEFLEGARIDEPRWAAFWQTLVLDTDPHLLKPHPQEADSPECLKLYVLLKRRSGHPLDDFRCQLLGPHAEKVFRLPALQRYLVGTVRDGAYAVGEPRFDALEVLSFEQAQEPRTVPSHPTFREIDASRLAIAEPRYVFTFMAVEHWIIRPGTRQADRGNSR